MLLALTSAVFHGSESLGTVTIYYCLIFETSFFAASYDSQGHGGGIRPRLHTGVTSLSDLHTVIVTLRETVCQSVSLGVEPHLGLMTRYLLFFDSYGLVSCGAPSLTRGRVCLLYMLLGPCQRSLPRVRVPWYSRPYFTVHWLTLFMSECSLNPIFAYRIEDTLSQGLRFPC
jgi:hypothetical protein